MVTRINIQEEKPVLQKAQKIASSLTQKIADPQN